MDAPKISPEKVSPTSLKLRVLAIREKLPKNAIELILGRYPEYDTAKGAKKIYNVLYGASSDELLTEFLESLVQPAVAQAA